MVPDSSTSASVDFAMVDWLQQQFVAESRHPERLYHVVRVVVDPAPDKGPPVRSGWSAFRPGVNLIGHADYREWQSCYQGSRERLHRYTGLAAKALRITPLAMVQVPGSGFCAQTDRDAFTFNLYHANRTMQNLVPIDITGSGRYQSTVGEFGEVLRRAIEDHEALRADEHLLDGWKKNARRLTGVPRFVYGSLALDVFEAAAFTIRVMLKYWDFLYYKPAAVLPWCTDKQRYFTTPQVRRMDNGMAVQLFVRVDLKESSVRIGTNRYSVTPDQALSFHMLCEAKGDWVTGTQMKALAQGHGYDKYRPDRFLPRLKKDFPELALTVEASRHGYRLNLSLLPESYSWFEQAT